MEVRVARLAGLETPHAQVRLRLRARQQGRHHDPHGELRPESDHKGREVRRSFDEVEAHVARVVVEVPNGGPPELRTHVQPVNLVERVVLRIQSPPEGRDPAEAEVVLHALRILDEGPRDVVRTGARLHPGRSPREELHSRGELLPLERPLHRRGAHVAAHAGDGADQRSGRVLLRQHLLEPRLGQDLPAAVPPEAPVAPHGLAIDSEALPARLLQQHRVHESPREAVAVRAPGPRQPEDVLRVLRRGHRNLAFVVQVSDAHRELQRKRLREAPRRAHRRGLVVHRGPTVGQALGELLGLRFLRGGSALALRDGAPTAVAEHIRSADELFEHSLHEVLQRVLVVHRVAARQLQRASLHEELDEVAHGNRTTATVPCTELLQEVCSGLLVALLPMPLDEPLAGRHLPRHARPQAHPPARHLATELELRTLEPAAEDRFLHLRVAVGGSSSSVAPCLFSKVACVQARRKQVLAGPRVVQRLPVTVDRALRHDLLVAHQVEDPRVVPLVHGPRDPVQPPAPDRGQRVQDVRHEAPRQLQALEHTASTEIPPQHQRVDAFQELRMPGHPDPRRHVRDLHEALAEAVVVRQHDLATGAHLLHGRRPHESSELVGGEQALLLAGGAAPVLQTALRRGQHHAGPEPRVHPVADLVAAHQADALRERGRVLREGNHVLPELRQPRPLRRHEGHLHVLQRHDQGHRQGRHLEQRGQLLVREVPHGVHVVPLAELRNHGVVRAGALALPLLLQLHRAPATEPALLLGDHEILLGRLQRRQLVPLGDLDVARRDAVDAVPQELQLQLRRRLVSRVERREPLAANVAREEHHSREHRVLRTDGLQRLLAQHQIELRNTQGQRLHR